MARFSQVASSASLAGLGRSAAATTAAAYARSPYISKLESIASSAVRAADRVGASLIVSGQAATHSGVRTMKRTVVLSSTITNVLVSDQPLHPCAVPYTPSLHLVRCSPCQVRYLT